MKPFRIVHFSDLHVCVQPIPWSARDLLTKRFVGILNQRYGRGHHFDRAVPIATELMREIRTLEADQIVFSGDATTLGYAEEFELARTTLGIESAPSRWAVATPGNHDYYLKGAERRGLFETAFREWIEGDRLDEEPYPFVRQVGDWRLIVVNSATPNRLFWDARGRCGGSQLARLTRLLKDLPPGPRLLVTHYPSYLPSGKPEKRFRKLRDRDDLIRICREGGVTYWLHGHRHIPYSFRDPTSSVPLTWLCSGSATQRSRWTYAEYTFSAESVQIRRRKWDPNFDRFSDAETETLPGIMG